MMGQLGEFGEKTTRMLKAENSKNLEPKSFLPNLYNVMADFTNNLVSITETLKFLFYQDKYYLDIALSQADLQEEQVRDTGHSLVQSHQASMDRLSSVLEELNSSKKEASVCGSPDSLETKGDQRNGTLLQADQQE
jgi:hypothetical protein